MIRFWFRTKTSAALVYAVTLFSALSGSTVSLAQDGEAAVLRPGVQEIGQSAVLNSRRFVFPAQDVDETYLIDVAPVISFGQQGSDQKLPVVFVVDGNLLFPNLASTAQLLSLAGFPSIIIVGVGYSRPSFEESLASRNRDLTPTTDTAFTQEMATGLEQMGMTYPSYGISGGADAFLAFINDELKPFIAAQYPNADLSDTAVVGHSLGGLFVLYALFTSPESFTRYIAGSPSLWWDEGVMLEAAQQSGDIDARLFMSYGALEPVEDQIEPGQAMDAILRGSDRPSLSYTFHVFEGETHDSVIAATLSRGLRAVFATQP